MRSDIIEQANAIRASMNTVTATLTDEEAIAVAELFLPWEIGVDYKVDDRRRYKEILYKCLQEHTSQADWTPDAVPALWAAINNGHAGTIDDPIPAARGMEYEYGKYYLDPEDGETYLCVRGGETGTIVLQYLPHELVGHYFEEVAD